MSDARNGSDPLADRVAALSPAKRALLELRLRQQRAEHQAGTDPAGPVCGGGDLAAGDVIAVSIADQPTRVRR